MSLASTETNAFTIAAYMRVTSLAISAYDYLETQPTAWRFYREHWQSRRLTISVVLFSLLRFVSIVTLTVSNIGFFYPFFTNETCRRFYLVPPSFKVAQAMVTQAILAIRAFNLSRRSKAIGYCLLVMYFVACVLQWAFTLVQRTPEVGPIHANCRAVNQVKALGAYLFYAIAMVYDLCTTSIAIYYLLKNRLASTNSLMAKLSKMMLYDGLGYLVALTAINIFNLILFKRSQDIQTAAASLGYCVSWIMSQRLLIHLYDASRERRENDSLEGAEITITKNIGTAREVSRVVRAQFDHKTTGSTPFELARRPRSSSVTDDTDYPGEGEEPSVQVRIEKTVKMKTFARTYELEDYSRRSRR